MHQRSGLAIIDAILLRGIIPLWVLAGAVFKLIERNPGNLPAVIRHYASQFELQHLLNPFMRLAIGIEILAAAIMIFVPRLSRLVAVALLALFCAILIAEIARGSSSCGCMGAVAMTPSTMIAIDGVMLLGAIVLGLLLKAKASSPKKNDARAASSPGAMVGIVPALIVGVIGFVLAIALPERSVAEPVIDPAQLASQDNANNLGQPVVPLTTSTQNSTTQGANASTPPAPPIELPPNTIANPNPTQLPGFYLTSSTASWVGKPATAIDLVKLMRIWPEDIATGTRHIIFYSRTCDHCESMFHDHLTMPHDRPITMVEIPFDRKQQRGPGAWSMPATDCQQLSLPIGPDWVITPPVIITIQNGIVTCAMEGQYEDCLGVEATHEH